MTVVIKTMHDRDGVARMVFLSLSVAFLLEKCLRKKHNTGGGQ